MVNEILFESFLDAAKTVPFLLVIYIGIELIEYKFGNKIRESVQKAGSAGPLIGAVAGSFPQCGFSVIAAALYTQRLVTIGTLLAVYLATSDEAIPVILAEPDKAGIILPLIATKIIIALIAGYGIDLVYKKANRKTLDHIDAVSNGNDAADHHHETVLEERACCGHSASTLSARFDPKEIFLHPVIHTLKIFVFIFLITLFLGLLINSAGEESMGKILLENSFAQPLLAALIGLIPNCAASVAITKLYLDGFISYGSVIAGLCASGGLGILVLFKEAGNKKEAIGIVGLLFVISVLAGSIIQFLS